MTLWQAIDDVVRSRLRAEVQGWWHENTRGPVRAAQMLAALSGAGRRLGREDVHPGDDAVEGLHAAGLRVRGRPWAELGRVGLLLSAAERLPSGELPVFIEEAYRTGDLAEKQAVLRALPHLPGAERFLNIAAEGARANALSIFTAIASENPYATRHFADEGLNQMVMKALFNGVALSTIMGLEGRMNADLRRMARDYGKERRAAGRPISSDLAWLEGEGESP